MKNGWCDSGLMEALLGKEEKIVSLLNEHTAKPSLLHGDLWSGNVYWARSGPALIDPACYFGSPEADLAFTEMFGGFSQAFYRAYAEVNPQLTGYEQRKDVLNLYHYMTHANLFGGGYISSVRRGITQM